MKIKITILFLILLFCITQTINADIKTFTGQGRSNAVSFVIDDTVYVGLGYNDNGALKDFWKYSTDNNAWISIADFGGDARMDAVAFVLDGKAYVGLGRSSYSSAPLGDFYEYDPVLNEWMKCSADFEGTARYAAVSFVIGNTAYVGTGCTGSKWMKDFWSFDGTSWSQLSSVFTSDGRQGAAAFVVNGKAYVTGGFSDGSYFLQLNDMQEYDSDTDTWTQKIFADGINLSTYGVAAFTYDNKGYICYGSKAFSVTYNPADNQVENIGDKFNFGTNRNNPVSFVLDGVPYVGLGSSGLMTTTYHNDFVPLFDPASIVRFDVSAKSNNAEYGSVTGGGNYIEGSTVSLTAVSGEGYRFVNWTIDNVEVSVDNPYSFIVEQNVEFTANFEEVSSSQLGSTIENSFSIYPNPLSSGGLLNVKNTQATVSVEIFDVAGVCVMSYPVQANVTTFNVDLPKGIYFVKSGNADLKLVVN